MDTIDKIEEVIIFIGAMAGIVVFSFIGACALAPYAVA